MRSIRRALGAGVTLVESLVPQPRARFLPGAVLYHYPACPFCLRVRLAMRCLGITLVCRDIDADPAYRRALKQGGGRVQVPCLCITREGEMRWLYESGAIIAWLRKHGRGSTHV